MTARALKILMLVAAILAMVIAALMMHGCATLGTAAKSCEPSADQELAILQAASNPVRADALAAIDGLGFSLCVLQAGVDKEIAQLEADARAAPALTAEADPDPRLANLKAWRAAHP